MANVKTNRFGFQYAIEDTLGVLPGSPAWRTLEPNSPDAFGGEISTEPRTPITALRGRKKGVVTDRDSTVEWTADLTMDAFTDFAEGFMFSEYANKEFDLKDGTGTIPPPATGTGYTIDAASALLAGKVQWVSGAAISLVFAKGYALAANNGLKPLTADLAGSGTEITVSGLSAETPPTNASLQVAGIRSDDCTFTVSGSTATLVSAADIDWTTVGLFVGQLVHLGSSTTAGAVQNAMQDSAANDTFGYMRLTAITATTLTGDKLDENLGSGGSPYTPATLDVMFGRFLRNVAVTASADDSEFLERSYQFEGSYPDLGGSGSPEYEYAAGNWANELAINIPLTTKATANWGFIGTQTEDIVVAGSRKTNAATPVAPLRTVAFSTASDIASLSTDLITLASDVAFKSLTLTIRNGVTAEKKIGQLGAVFMNHSTFEVDMEGQMLFTNKEIINAINDNTTTTFLAILKNEDGAMGIDLPALTFKGGDREFPVGQTILVNLTGESHDDPDGTIPDVSVGISLFASVPTVRP